MTTVKATTQITLIDLNDAIIAGAAPSNPVNGTLWIDSSATPNILKQWNGTAWATQSLSLANLDNGASTTLNNNNTALSDMANDAKVTQQERISIKDEIQSMVGSVPTDTYTLPTIATIDASGVGQLYQIRKAALNAGIGTTDTNYINLGTAYTTLATYLNGLSPLPWNVTSTTTTTITAATWRADWNAYYNALYNLQQVITSVIQGNFDGIQIGGRNLYLDSYLERTVAYNAATIVSTSYQTTNSNWVRADWQTTAGNFGIVEASTDRAIQLTAGLDYTLSFDIRGTITNLNYTYFMRASAEGSNSRFTSQNVSLSTTTWTRVNITTAAPWTTSTGYILIGATDGAAGKWFEVKNVKLEQGNIPTDWTPAPEDVQGHMNAIQVGGKNYLVNTGNFQDLDNWSLNMGSAIAGDINIFQDATYGNVIQANLTTNAASGNTWWVINNNNIVLPGGKFTIGNLYTISFMIMNAIPLYFNFRDADGTDPVASGNYTIPVNAQWTKVSWTFKATATGVTPTFYLAKNDNTSTGAVYLTQVMLEDGNKPSGWNPAPEELQAIISTTSSTATTAYDNATESGITSTLELSSTFQGWMGGKAPSDVADGLAATGYVDAAQAAAQAYADGQIAGLGIGQFATKQYVDDSSTDITTHFSYGGGVNMLKNSVGFANTSFWTATGTNGAGWTTQAVELNQFGTKSGFSLQGGTLTQNVTVTPNIPYTVSVLVKKGSAGTGYLKVYETGQSFTSSFLSGSTYNYQKFSTNIVPSTSTITVEINGDAASLGTIFTALMFNIGMNPFQWTLAQGEVYNTAINMDINGIQVEQIDPTSGAVTGYTVMTPTKFAGYKDQLGDGNIDTSDGSDDEIFRMDTDTFHMKSATIGTTVKMVAVTGTHNGIAFIPSS